MSSYLNNLLTNTTSRYNNLRRQLLSDEADGDTEDDSHLAKVLRAYYTEQGRPFPPWLPPDQKTPQPAPTQFASSSGRPQGQAAPMGRGGGLSDLWDAPQQQQPPQEPLSLRRGVGGRGGGARPPQARPGMGSSLTPEPQMHGRPLPSQRAGSYQSSVGGRPPADASPPPSAGAGTTAQDRLKARLWGAGRSTSPAQRGISSETVNSARSPYEQPASQGARPPYPDDRNNSYGSSSSGGGRQQSSSGMAANSPWSGKDDPYAPQGGGGYGGGAPPQRGPQGGRVGLPNGPRMR